MDKIENICRVCMEEKVELYSIFVGNEPMSKILTECTQYRVECDDNLPHHMCVPCMQAAQAAFQFKQQAERAVRTLTVNYQFLKKEPTYDPNWFERGIESWTQTNSSCIYPCEVCGEKFFESSDLRAHRALEHKISTKRCGVCGEVFEKLRQLKSHLAQKHPDKGYTRSSQCPVCLKLFSRRDHMKRHLKNIHGQGGLKRFYPHSSAKIYLEESIARIKEDPFEVRAGINNEDGTSSSAVHEVKYTEGDEMKSINDKTPTSVGDINPISTNEAVPKDQASKVHLQCPDCPKQFERKGFMKRHMQNVHGHNAESTLETTYLEEPEIEFRVEGLKPPETEMESGSFPVDAVKDMNIPSADMNPISTDEGKLLDIIVKSEAMNQYYDENSMTQFSDPDHSDSCMDNDNEVDETRVKIEAASAKEVFVSDILPLESMSYNFPKVETFTQNINTAKRSLTRRRHFKSDQKDNSCQVCQRVFSRHCHLLRHMLTHSEEKAHACSHCDKRFARSDHLKKHVINLHGAKEFKCDQCDAAFPRSDALARHKDAKHSDDPNASKAFTCEYCMKKFTTSSYLVKHKLLHTDRIFACKFCEETFRDRTLYREHVKTHRAPRSFLCSICGESFQRNDYLVVHMRRHNGEKPYKCKFCDKGFPRRTDVKIHERYHTGHKPNLCTLCGKGFYRAFNLTIHMRTHTGERPFKCDHCEKSFAQSNDLKAHIRRHTGERFKCTHCDASFIQMYGLRKHAWTEHGIQMESSTGRLEKFGHTVFGTEVPSMPMEPSTERLEKFGHAVFGTEMPPMPMDSSNERLEKFGHTVFGTEVPSMPMEPSTERLEKFEHTVFGKEVASTPLPMP